MLTGREKDRLDLELGRGSSGSHRGRNEIHSRREFEAVRRPIS